MFGKVLERLRLRRRSEPPRAATPQRAANYRAEARKGLGGFVEWIEGGGVRPKK